MLQIKNGVVLIFWCIQCLYLMYSEVAWVLVSLGTQVQPQIILYLSVSYDYGKTHKIVSDIHWNTFGAETSCT